MPTWMLQNITQSLGDTIYKGRCPRQGKDSMRSFFFQFVLEFVALSEPSLMRHVTRDDPRHPRGHVFFRRYCQT